MNKYMPYEIDLKFQYRTYKNIGETHKIDFKAKKNFLYKIWRITRIIFNKNEKSYKNFNTFSQWENYVCEEFNEKKFTNQKDCIHYLKRSKRNKEIFCDMVGAIITPIYVVLLTMGATLILNTDIVNNYTNNWYLIKAYIMRGYIYMSIILVFVLFILMFRFLRYRTKINFFKDLIEVLENKNANH